MSIYMPIRSLQAARMGSRIRSVISSTIQSSILAEYAPDLPSLIEAREVIAAEDLEQTRSPTSGHIFHGEQALNRM